MSRKFLWALGLGVLAAALSALPASAQEQGRGRGRGGFGGGGFGQQTVFSLVRNEAVQKEIGLTDASKVTKIAEEQRDAVRSEMESAGIDFQGLRDLSAAERETKMREIRTKSAEVTKKVNDKFEPQLKEALTAEQFKRLGEIKVQAEGIDAFQDESVAKDLGLSDEQKKKIADIRTEGQRSMRELFTGGNFNEEARTKFREATAKTLAQATDVLDAGQKEKFAALKGKPFDVAQLRGGGQRGRGEGGNTPGRGRRGNNPNRTKDNN